MEFIKVGKAFKSKTGKSTTVLFNESDIKLLQDHMKPNEKYGKQVAIIVTGTPDSQYGHSISIMQ